MVVRHNSSYVFKHKVSMIQVLKFKKHDALICSNNGIRMCCEIINKYISSMLNNCT